MDIEQFNAKIVPFAIKYWLPLCLAIVGMILFVSGLIALFYSNSKEPVNFSQNTSRVISTSDSDNFIVIDVEGAVVAPGVYRLKQGSIIQDGLISAKGLSDSADREYIAKNTNLAQKLVDGQKIYIPKLSEKSQSQNFVDKSNSGNLIDINSASIAELDSLSGIGQITAQKIINNRPYASINDLLEKNVVSSKVFTGIKDKINAF
jgi:competence protein ComEA